MIRAKSIATSCAVVIAALLAWGCSSSNSQAPQFSASGKQHPTNWVQNHWAEYSKNPAQCTPCHGSTTEPQKSGGTSGVSCFSCHPTGGPHQVGWEDAMQHGRLAAMQAPGNSSGMASCTKCHGTAYQGGLTATTCFQCHQKAPHPDAPWNGSSASKVNHNATDSGNAPACYACHAAGANSSLKPSTPAADGTAPGCFNNTMCHGRSF